MAKKARSIQRREASLSRESIVEATIEILDSSGERGLTFRALSERLVTGPGAIYGHIEHKGDLLTAACDAIIARTTNALPGGATPDEAIRALALGMFDAIDAHPWLGSALIRAPGQLPMVRIFERIGQPVRALGVAPNAQWAVVSALLSYIIGVSVQNAANAHLAQEMGAERDSLLADVSAMWSTLDAHAYPFTRSVAAQLPVHDDRADFLAGIDLILRGIGTMPRAPARISPPKKRRTVAAR
ncbi:AcrR family transcriptional regulator [Paraburkholderia sp. GAS199]|uniref:TetR/AcrR family transcriptional regulator n=1 Tax=Paraburkholderia sp. GAS199 TaxID=3035126 RepID=UPI003D251413